MSAKEMFFKERFYKLETSLYVGGITYIMTMGKEYEEISFLDDEPQVILKNIDSMSPSLIKAIQKQIEELGW